MFAESISYKIKIKYFKSCLEKDASFYDEHNPTEMASKISKEVSTIQRGIGEKVGALASAYSAFIFGFAFAFYFGWQLTLILLAAFPLFAMIGGSMGAALQSGIVQQMKAFS